MVGIIRSATSIYPPTADHEGRGNLGYKHQYFGGPHASWLVVLCDGSVHSFSFFMDPQIHHRLGNRHDGEVIDAAQF